jgi:hypothetical protein
MATQSHSKQTVILFKHLTSRKNIHLSNGLKSLLNTSDWYKAHKNAPICITRMGAIFYVQ